MKKQKEHKAAENVDAARQKTSAADLFRALKLRRCFGIELQTKEKVEEFFLSSARATFLPPHEVLTKRSAETFAKGQKRQRSDHSSGRC